MNAQEIIAKADRGEGLTEEEIKVYRAAVKPQKHLYGKYGSLAKKYLEEHNVGKFWAIENLPEYLRRTSCTKVCMRSCRKMSGIRGREIFWKITAVRRRSGRLLRVRFFLNLCMRTE